METGTVGRVLTEARIESLKDLWEADRGLRPPDQVREILVPDALVDTSSSTLSLPSSLIARLGLSQTGTRRIRSAIGPGEVAVFEAVRLTIQGRDCTMDVLEVPDGTPVLIGQLALEILDFVVDMTQHALIGNPRHGGEFILDMY